MNTNKPLARWAQWSAGLALLAVALTAGGLSLAVNITAGLGVGLAVAVAYGLADCGKLLLPIVCTGIGWNVHTRGAYAVVSVVSILCAICYLADANGGQLIEREHAATVQADNAQQIAELEAELATLRKLAADEAGNGGCGPQCKALQDRADKAAQKLQDARKARAGADAVTLPGSAVLAANLAGSSENEAARSIAIAKSVAALAVMELLAHLAGAAAALIGMAMRPDDQSKSGPVANAPKSGDAVAKLKREALATNAKPGTAAYYLQRLRKDHAALAAQVDAGKLSIYRASIAAGLRKAPKAKRKWSADDYVKAPVEA
jgi:hypothetical protein